MKKLFYLFLLLGFAVTSCNKPDAIPLEQDVTFKAIAFETNFKVSDDDVCNGDIVHYAKLTIETLDGNGDHLNPVLTEIIDVDIFYLNGTMYTNSLKMIPGIYDLVSFTLMNENDEIVYASPMEGSPNSDIVDGLPIEFSVGAFLKNEVKIEVLCFDPVVYTDFGFSWFSFDFSQVGNNDFVFFGDFCTKYFENYANEPRYAAQGTLHHDMIAIFKIDIFEKIDNGYGGFSWGNKQTYTNEGESLNGPLIVPHPNTNVPNEEFKIRLSILVKDGESTFKYKVFKKWFITDDEDIYSGIDGDNVIDFVLGSCVPDADYVFPPYMNLPETAIMTLQNPGANSYWDMTLSGFGAGYDIEPNTVLPGHCGDRYRYISEGIPYDVEVFSSLYPNLLPDYFDVPQGEVLDNINWLGNNLYRYPGYTSDDFQFAVWSLLSQAANGELSPIALQMASDADVIGEGFVPPVGGWAAVLFVKEYNNGYFKQLIFTLVDP